MKENTLITISRQYGSGGREIAELLAKKRGVRCYDRQILYLAAEKLGNSDMNIETVLEMSYKTPENTMGSILGGLGLNNRDMIPSYNKMYREQAKIIRSIAQKGGAVFVGRCADAILKEFEESYSFYIYANEEFREARAKEQYGNMSIKEMDKENKTRERYYNYYTGEIWGNPQNYDLMLNTSNISMEAAADIIWNYIERIQGKG